MRSKLLEMLKEVERELKLHAETGDWDHHAEAMQMLTWAIEDLQGDIAKDN